MRSLVGLGLALVVLAPSVAAAQSTRAYPVQMISQLGRGVVNVLMAPIEVPVNMWKEGNGAVAHDANKGRQMIAMFTGAVTGTGYMCARVGVGFWEVVSFPYPTRPLMQPSTPDGFFETLARDDETGKRNRPAEMAWGERRRTASGLARSHDALP